MERVTISMSDEFAAELSAFMERAGYANRSEALGDLARLGLQRERMDASAAGECVAMLSYVYNHETRELSRRLTSAHHDHHHLHVATMHVHLDHENCLEVSVLRGEAEAVREFTKEVVAQRGVTHGNVTFVPVTLEAEAHRHGDGAVRHLHAHPQRVRGQLGASDKRRLQGISQIPFTSPRIRKARALSGPRCPGPEGRTETARPA